MLISVVGSSTKKKLQVWALTQFFLLLFCKKIIDLPEGQINDPSSKKHFSLPLLPATPSSMSRTLEGLFELTRRLSRALDLPRALLPELQRIKDTHRQGCRARRGGPRTPSRTTDANFDCTFVENALLFVS